MASVGESVSTNKRKRDGQRELQKEAQGRREPNLGPGPVQILRISGFVNSKTDRKNAIGLSRSEMEPVRIFSTRPDR